MEVHVRLFALARQLAHRDVLVVELSDKATVGELRAAIGRSYPSLSGLVSQMLIAIDEEFADDDTVVRTGAEIACIPPVSGGEP